MRAGAQLPVCVAFVALAVAPPQETLPRGRAGAEGQAPAARQVEALRAVRTAPSEIVGSYREPAAFAQARSGSYFVFDRRGQAVYGIDQAQTATWKIVGIGHEPGRILDPTAFALEPGGTFVVADAPDGQPRIQRFAPGGRLLGGFLLRDRGALRVTVGGLVLNGIGSIHYTGHSVLLNQPETGSLISEYSLDGSPIRAFGDLRPTGQEHDPDVHLALNIGLPIGGPSGDVYFVFQAGVPLFRKYDEDGKLVFERHVEGPELDETLASLPTVWPKRKGDQGTEIPVVSPTIRAAAVDPAGNLWLAFSLPVAYVYDSQGEKRRTVEFRAGGLLAPTSLFFASPTRLLATPGCFEFDAAAEPRPGAGSSRQKRNP